MSGSNQIDAITLEVLRNALESVAEEMGAVLKLTSYSPNIKERMDASCAVFDRDAQLVAQAEHVPVHLGAMLRAVSRIVADIEPLEEGDVVVVNDPFVNGAHLPDISLVAPVFLEGRLAGYVSNRAHHSDVGGMEPGSMPGNSRSVYQEGLIIPTVLLYRRGVLQRDIMRMILANVRTPEERRGDLNAQLSSLRVGERRLQEIAARYGVGTLLAGFDAIMDYAERRMRRRLAELPAGIYRTEDMLDDDGAGTSPVLIRLAVTVSRERLVLDFTGSAPQLPGNVNAVQPMAWSGSFFAIKLLADPSLPVNAGTFRPVEVILPEDCFLDAQSPAAVCAGNTETTQRVADTVLRAFAQMAPDRIPAASQGTMNLISIGGRDPRNGRAYTYIETIAGGQGGRPMGPGQDGVQCNMTNTMNTPVESLEITYPLRVERYELREGSPGQGRHRGGMGVVRTLRVLGHDARISLQGDRRLRGPYGLHGGTDGAPGRNRVRLADGTEHAKPGKTSFTLGADDQIIVETPGGGGWGAFSDATE